MGSMGCDEWGVTNGVWRMGCGEWGVANGVWRMGSDKWECDKWENCV